jgi:cytochrome c peroxidase
MHAGQFASLEDVVRFYSTLEGAVALDHHRESVLVRLDLTARERRDLVAFLSALTGTAPPMPWGDAPERRRPAPDPDARNPGH